MEKTTLNIPKIMCNHCVMTIKNELMELNGVNSAEGNPETKNFVIEYEAPATLDKIKALLKEINYPEA
jgi:copper chaperone